MTLPVLVTVTAWDGLVDPTATLPKSSEVGLVASDPLEFLRLGPRPRPREETVGEEAEEAEEADEADEADPSIPIPPTRDRGSPESGLRASEGEEGEEAKEANEAEE